MTIGNCQRIRKLLPAFLLAAGLFAAGPVCTQNFTISEETLAGAEKKYGPTARNLLIQWQNLVVGDQSTSDREKLEKVNDFFNQMEFVDDRDHWNKEDYWATPVEFIASQGGDCEDFSVAKYFTLKALGVEENKLTLTYVKALKLNQHHMVVTYYETPGAIPLVLDNLVTEIRPATERPDLLPIYTFNGTGLWLAKQRGRGKLAGSSSRLKRWQDLMERMVEGRM